MKPLDEIIYHICADNSDVNTDDFREDVLCYLKQYKEILPDYVALKEYWAHEQENPPLTWQELKQMKGKPVWVEEKDYKNRWNIIRTITDSNVIFEIGMPFAKWWQGDLWQAYRKERE